MTPTNEDLLALADRADSWNRCYPGNLNVELLVADLSAALRVLVAERQAIRDKALEDADYVGELVLKARAAATKASIKFPQPNYVALKIAEEAGEVVRGAVHYAEGRMEWEEVEGEIVQLLAMLIRFVTEGDEINGVIPPAAIRAKLRAHLDGRADEGGVPNGI